MQYCQRKRKGNEEGYILLGVLILLFIFTIALAVAAPQVAKSIQRDKEEEAVQRGKQYKRALRLYYKKFNTYPTTIAQLETTNNVRFLRKRYVDPMTGKDDWRIIHVGEAKVPVLGFFGQPLQGGTSSTTTGLANNGTGGGLGAGIGGAGNSGGLTNSGSSFGSGSGLGSGNGSGDGTAPAAPPAGVLPGMSGGGVGAGAGTAGTNGTDAGTGTGTGSSTGTGGLGTSIASQSSAIGGGSVGPIVGFGLAVDKKSLVIYHKQDAYNKWEFTYDPIEEQMYSSTGGLPGAQPIAGAGNGPAGTGGIGGGIPGGGGLTGGQGGAGLTGGGGSGSTGNTGPSGTDGSGSGTSSSPPANNPY